MLSIKILEDLDIFKQTPMCIFQSYKLSIIILASID